MDGDFDLQRFKAAQDAELETALNELRRGRKRSHWIWYVFPQLAGLGRSGMAIRYGLHGAEEAAAYLRDPLLRARLLEAATLVEEHLARRPAAALPELMGSHIDALKLVSSMTLFREVATSAATDEEPDVQRMRDVADSILRAAARQGYAPCRPTLEVLTAGDPPQRDGG